jgi:hypothetical protein
MKHKIFSIATLITIIFSVQLSFAQDALLDNIIKLVSPVEVSALMKELGIQYDGTILNNPNNVAKYQTDFKKAVALGVYSTDLGYANINGQSGDALAHLGSVKKAAEGLSLGEYIDVNKILGLAMNKDNLNKLLDETSNTFENISTHLEKNKKSDLAAAILTSGWLETLHITCEIAKKHPNKELSNRIIQQKLILEQILKVLEYYKSNTDIKGLLTDLNGLNTLFSKYKFDADSQITTTSETINGIEIVSIESTNSAPELNITAEEINTISAKVAEIRNKMCN